MDNNAQASAELILLFGGIMVVVLLAIYMYKVYVMDLGGEIKSKEVNEFNAKLEEISEIFTWFGVLKSTIMMVLKLNRIM